MCVLGLCLTCYTFRGPRSAQALLCWQRSFVIVACLCNAMGAALPQLQCTQCRLVLDGTCSCASIVQVMGSQGGWYYAGFQGPALPN
jgi:hypothetical protein